VKKDLSLLGFLLPAIGLAALLLLASMRSTAVPLAGVARYPTVPFGETPPIPTSIPSPYPTNTPMPFPTSTPWPTSPGEPTDTPGPTAPGEPTETVPPDVEVVDVAVPVPPEPIPAPWVGVVDYLVENVYAQGIWQGVWIVNTNSSLYEQGLLRYRVFRANPVAEGDLRPVDPVDNVHIARPQCLVNGEWVYVPGTWYYNGTSSVVVDPSYYGSELIHYGPPGYPEEFDVLRRYHFAYVPEPAYPDATVWNFGALGECSDLGGGGEPTPAPPPPPTPPPPVPECPSCNVTVSPYGTLESPYLVPRETITLTWNCAHPPEASLAGYTMRAWAYDGSSWSVVANQDLGPYAPRQVILAVVPGLVYHARVTARFDVGGNEQGCCSGDTYFRYSMVMPPELGSPEARLDYYSDHDSDPSRGPNNPYRTTGPFMLWNFGEFLHAHPSAEWTHPAYPGWQARTDILKWRYRGSEIGGTRYPARCTPPAALSCDWQEEQPGPLTYLHLRWYKYLMAGESENLAAGGNLTWVYVTNPLTVSLSYDVQAETTWTNTETGFEVTWPAFTQTLTVTVDLKYVTTYRYDWPE
jgi:hypothetical protein